MSIFHLHVNSMCSQWARTRGAQSLTLPHPYGHVVADRRLAPGGRNLVSMRRREPARRRARTEGTRVPLTVREGCRDCTTHGRGATAAPPSLPQGPMSRHASEQTSMSWTDGGRHRRRTTTHGGADDAGIPQATRPQPAMRMRWALCQTQGGGRSATKGHVRAAPIPAPNTRRFRQRRAAVGPDTSAARGHARGRVVPTGLVPGNDYTHCRGREIRCAL